MSTRVPDERGQASAGLSAVAGKLAGWYAARAELRALGEAEHPPFDDRFGRTWAWVSGDDYGGLWQHDDTLALPRDMIERLTSLPPERLRANPNYWRLCDTCRSGWADTSPVSPRILLAGQGWFDVRDSLFYARQQGAAFYVPAQVTP